MIFVLAGNGVIFMGRFFVHQVRFQVHDEHAGYENVHYNFDQRLFMEFNRSVGAQSQDHDARFSSRREHGYPISGERPAAFCLRKS